MSLLRDIIARLMQLRALVSRKVTLQDLREIIIKMIDEVREGRILPERFDYNQFIDVDLEA